MFDFGFGIGELIIIGVIGLIVVGPEDFPKMMYSVGRFFSHLRDLGTEFKNSMDDIVHEQEIQKIRQDIAEKIVLERENDTKISSSEVKSPPESSPEKNIS